MAASSSAPTLDDERDGCASCDEPVSEGRKFCSPGCASQHRARQRLLEKMGGGSD